MDINNLLRFENIFMLLVLLGFPVCIYFLINQKKKLQKRIDRKIEIFKKVFDILEDAILVLSDKNEVLYVNRSMINLLGLKGEFLLKPLEDMPKVMIKKEVLALDIFIQKVHNKSTDGMQSFPQSDLLLGRNTEGIPVNLYIDSTSKGNKDALWRSIISIHNLTEEKKRISAAHRHKLTGLANQSQALLDLNALYSKVHLNDKKLALMLLNIDNFSQLRAIVGYEQTDVILMKFAKYLEQTGKELSFSVYHTHYNNFLLTIPNVESSDEIILLSKQIQEQLALFYKMGNVKVHLTASIGISIYPESGSTLNLFNNVYKALAQAEKSGYGRMNIYEPSVLKHEYDELIIYNGIHEAIEKREFEIYYQPIIEVKDKEIVAAEALIRWKHPVYGFISPDVFIPIIEKTGFIIELGQYVLEEVLKQQKRWELFKFKQIEVSINMSLLEIETKGFVENVARQLVDHQIDPELIKFEITESSAMSNAEEVDRELHELKNLGVSIALDDFGTGFTSFEYLRKFPANILKLDKTLVDYVLENQDDQRILKAMIDLGHNLGMKVVVEGIENKKMFDIVSSYGCDYVQGYYFSKPLPVFEFQKMLRK